MSDQIINANLTISGVEITATQIKIKDENKKTYSFFKTKKDGGMTKAYEAFQNYKVGDTVGIGYKEVAFTGKDGTQGKIKSILSFGPVNSAAMLTKNAPQPVSSSTEQTYKSPRGIELQSVPGGRNWDREAYEKCCSIWAAAAISSPTFPGRVALLKDINDGDFWELFQAIRKDGEKRFTTGMDKARLMLKPVDIDVMPPQDIDMEMGNAAITKAQADMVDGMEF